MDLHNRIHVCCKDRSSKSAVITYVVTYIAPHHVSHGRLSKLWCLFGLTATFFRAPHKWPVFSRTPPPHVYVYIHTYLPSLSLSAYGCKSPKVRCESLQASYAVVSDMERRALPYLAARLSQNTACESSGERQHTC